MYSGRGFRKFEIGDVDVVRHDGIFHLFHLVLPNHDYIAHAVSEDGLNWRRVDNALFISDPGAWDDDMLWTMHVSPDPHDEGCWRMFYTGLSMREQGLVQRVGVARSPDLYRWTKDDSGRYPLEIADVPYESRLDQGRRWVSFRDPFFCRVDGKGYLLAAARVNEGPIIRRGCVALASEIAPDRFEFLPPLYFPRRYDDLEVPTVVRLGSLYYLIASTREDIKVHYWCAESFLGPYVNFADNVLLPQGNYAARPCFDGERVLLWNFFYKGLTTRGDHMLPPPKELLVDDLGELYLGSYRGFDEQVEETLPTEALTPLRRLFGNPDAEGGDRVERCEFGSDSGFEAFLVEGVYRDFRLRGALSMEGRGKAGLVLRLDGEGDGYYLSLDLFKGVAQLRAWQDNPDGLTEEAFLYDHLQAGHFLDRPGPHPFALLAYGNYLEFTLYGRVLLTLADDRFREGAVGFYVESARLSVEDLALDRLRSPTTEDYPSVSSPEAAG